MINFPDIAAAALRSADRLLPMWLPQGRFDGHEYKSRNPKRADAREGSFSINVNTGAWADFATDDKGGDLISLYKYLNDSPNQGVAAKAIAEDLRIDVSDMNNSPAQPVRKSRTEWKPLLPIPADVPSAPAHMHHGKPAKRWEYRDTEGHLLGYINRYNTRDGDKEIVPQTYCEHQVTKKRDWRWAQFPEPRPLYGLDRLALKPDACVLIVEGEKCADYATEAIPDIVAVSWPGGCKAVDKVDWSPLYGRKIITFADADCKREKISKAEEAAGIKPESKPYLPKHKQAGFQAMEQIRNKLADHCPKIWDVELPEVGSVPDGWDIADMVEAGVNVPDDLRSRMKVWSKENLPPPPPPVGEPTRAKKKKQAPDEFDKKVRHLLEHFALIDSTKTVFDAERSRVVEFGAFALSHDEEVVKHWKKHPERITIQPEDVRFAPDDPSHKWNLFKGLGTNPVDGNCEMLLKHIRYLCKDRSEVYNYLLDWIAYPLQHVGAKLTTAVVMRGAEGSGKNMLWSALRKIYGQCSCEVGQAQMESDYNDWISGKLLVIMNEVLSRREKYQLAGKLKSLITEKGVAISAKFLPTRWEENHANMAFLSNELLVVPLGESDRRYFVIDTPKTHEDGERYFSRLSDYIDNGGAEAFHAYLLRRDLSNFSPYRAPPRTPEFYEALGLSLTPAENFIREWKSGELDCMINGSQTVYAGRSEDIYLLFEKWCKTNGEKYISSANEFARRLTEAGFSQDRKYLSINGVRKQCRVRWLEEKLPDSLAPEDFDKELERLGTLMYGNAHPEPVAPRF